MGTPFTAEDQLVKRSLLSSILGVANRLRTAQRGNNGGIGQSSSSGNDHQTQQHFDGQQQPCCSSQLFAQNIQQNNQQIPPIPFQGQQRHSAGEAEGHSSFQQFGNTNSDLNFQQSQQQFSPLSAQFPPNVSPSGQSSPTTALGLKFGAQLDLNAFMLDMPQQNNQIGHLFEADSDEQQIERSQHEIYREIVRECRAFEQQTKAKESIAREEGDQMEEEEHRIVSAALEALPAALVATSPNPPLPLANSLNTANEVQKLQTNLHSMVSPLPPLSTPAAAQWFGATGGGLSLEHLVKIVVATVREVTSNAGGQKEFNDGQKDDDLRKATMPSAVVGEESAEVILERRRQQNNAAAARYRKRQRQVESGLGKELAQLERRNWELRAEVAKCRESIEAANAQLKRKQWKDGSEK